MARTLIKFTKGTDIVFIAATRVKENYINAITAFTVPTQEDSPNTTSLINLNKVEERFIIDGYISEGKLDPDDTKTTGFDKKELLKTMFGKGSIVTLTYEDIDYSVAVDKYDMDYVGRDDADSTQSDTVVYTTKITCIQGTDLI